MAPPVDMETSDYNIQYIKLISILNFEITIFVRLKIKDLLDFFVCYLKNKFVTNSS